MDETIKLEVKSLLSGVSPAYRLLNVTVINVDDHRPQFSLSEAERIIYLSNETIALRAEDDDLPPFNSIYYYLLPKCGNTKFAEINEISGRLIVKNNIPDGSKICVYASSIKLDDDIGSLYYEKHNKAMIKVTIKRADSISSSTSILLNSDLKLQSIDLKIMEPFPDRHYDLKSTRFFPLKGAPVDVNDLISVDSASGILLFDPRIIDEPEGTYLVNVNIQGPDNVNAPVQHLVYYIRDYNQLRFVFDNNVDNVGLNLEAFKHQLEGILSGQRRRNVTVINGRSCGLTEFNQKRRTKICFFLTEHDKILDYETSLDWLSTTSNANPRLIDLYSKFRVVDVDRCLDINSLLLHSSSLSLDREQLVWIFVIFCLITLVILLIGYSCLVKRIKDRVNNGFFNAL
ncbi:unnamed protein product [Bursaphelenchus xylophilus]|uniref:(pine wood nematode) hypothetical protein n=1 Tax=Bursaphelenchus xylophilus TaxID=6326 RepID=A0A1I7S3G5_BURXY|nr:unnamed protein product [Bursaphelenchus xylophilus]CAG9116294.1 unnamed protein product [Bursaphelenchus xylophilus]